MGYGTGNGSNCSSRPVSPRSSGTSLIRLFLCRRTQSRDGADAPHASEIEFVFRVLSSRNLPWRAEDQMVSELISSYWTNFAKTGIRTDRGCRSGRSTTAGRYQVMHIEANQVPLLTSTGPVQIPRPAPSRPVDIG